MNNTGGNFGMQRRKLWLIERFGKVKPGEMISFVVCAIDEKEARRLAAEECGNEGAGIWLGIERTACKELKVKETPVGVVAGVRY